MKKKKKKPKQLIKRVAANRLFERVVAILEEARVKVVRSEYGERIISNLSGRLSERYGQGFSTTNLRTLSILSLIGSIGRLSQYAKMISHFIRSPASRLQKRILPVLL
ncbi:MAG: hypothetical protein A3C46_04450 [Deltaproteobacteria bacterium RIFCSPHIGHO2_02_FULL_44_16]|nr:MAG: hypothetical protein A3C46_04450 [Deltaproteobacteria bacterium RIFCSPHIGHO2_02_FULL_44_16]